MKTKKEERKERLKKIRKERKNREERSKKIASFRKNLNEGFGIVKKQIATGKVLVDKKASSEVFQYLLSSVCSAVWVNVVTQALPSGTMKTALTFLQEWGLL